ncbi:hypothetical protein [Rhizobium tubonense]|uniref:Uncharacterized protein n=1 Tax=Rhizobium tubonense TaxID=484088 RepID=A0A2W4E7F4_9HYPH|nr:hypothetical protein [Rhizobium tubonense]PZM11306.1 hypothetical protein CPY51_21370 [Rhizobium tubonense]
MALTRQGTAPFLTDGNAHIAMLDDQTPWVVIVTEEAIDKMASSSDVPVEQLTKFMYAFEAIANAKLARHHTGDDGTIWIRSADINRWKADDARPL